MDLVDIIKVVLFLLVLLGSMMMYPGMRAFALLLTGVAVLLLSLKAKKSTETEDADTDSSRLYLVGFVFGAGVTFIGICSVLNLLF